MKPLSRKQALAALGLQEGASQEDIRRTFRQLALQYHPDKNLGSPDEAAEQFKQLLRAYQRLTAARHADAAWEDLGLADLLTEEFLDEALAQQLPVFELMFMQHHMSTTAQQEAFSCWGDDSLGVVSGAKNSPTWKQVYTALQRKHAHSKQSVGDEVQRSTSQQPSSARLKDARWRLLWEFVSDLVLREDNAQSSGMSSQNRWAQTAGSSTSSNRPAYSSSGSDASSDASSDGDVDSVVDEQQAAWRAERRRRYQRCLRADQQVRQCQQEQGKVAGSCDIDRPHSIASGKVCSSGPAGCHPNSGEDLQRGDMGYQIQRDVQGDASQLHAAASPTSAAAQVDAVMQASRTGAAWSLAVIDGDPAQPASVRHMSRGKTKPGFRRPRWLTASNCWLWTKRILLLKALAMLLRP